ncbi:MAG: kynureninase [Deltaproteobacteria bacterium]|nr:kynureninase [Deltaproteobacteria bacterium]
MTDPMTEARRLDDDDVLASFRSEFCFPQTARGDDVVYFTGNSLGLMPKKTRETVGNELEAWARLGVEGHFAATGAAFAAPKTAGSLPGPAEPWFSYHALVAERAAAMVGARPREVVAMGSLTANLHLLMVSFYRPTKQKHKIVIEGGAFPSDRFLVQSQARFHGFDDADAVIEIMPRAGESLLRSEDIEAVLEREKDSIALMLLSGINYYTGQLFDIRRLTRFARARDIVVGWDLAHAAGNVPLSLHDDDADFAAWCTYKYVNSGPGAVAMSFVHERHAQAFDLPRFCGWWSAKPATRFAGGELDLEEGADGWQISNAPILSMAALHASLDVFARAGMPRIREKSLALTGFLERLVDDVKGVSIITPRDPSARGAQLSLRVPADRLDAAKLTTLLHEQGVCVDFRRPDVVRAAPAPLYCRFVDVVRFVDILRACV